MDLEACFRLYSCSDPARTMAVSDLKHGYTAKEVADGVARVDPEDPVWSTINVLKRRAVPARAHGSRVAGGDGSSVVSPLCARNTF